MLWSTSMEIPVGAPDPQAALEWINYVYDPEVQADIAEYVNYVTPVAGVKEILARARPRAGKQPADLPERGVHRQLLVRAGPRRRAGRAGDRGVRERGHGLTLRTLSIAGAADDADRARPAGDARALCRARRRGSRRRRARAAAARTGASPLGPAGAARGERRLRARGRLRDPRPADRAPRPDRGRAAASGWCRARSTSARGERLYNTAIAISPQGELVAAYRKAFPWQPLRDHRRRRSLRRLRDSRGRPDRVSRSATTGSSPRPSASSPGWAPRSSSTPP